MTLPTCACVISAVSIFFGFEIRFVMIFLRKLNEYVVAALM